MKSVRRILLAIKNTSPRRHAAVDKAIGIAKALGASLEIFNAISSPVFLEIQPLTGRSLADLRREVLAQRQRDLGKLAARAGRHGVHATCAVDWDYPPHEAIVRRARAIDAELVIAEVHEGPRLTPWLMHLTDWELLRLCPVPVLIFKNTRAWHRPVVLAAVDPAHAHAKPAALDEAIVDAARALARHADGKLEVVHANHPPFLGMAAADGNLDAGALAAAFESRFEHQRRAFESFALRTRVPPEHCHVLGGSPTEAIPRAARHFGADVVVMGAVSRSGLRRVFIGNTAERILGALPCDVLVVKPANVARPVARKPRGMRVVAPLPVVPLHG